MSILPTELWVEVFKLLRAVPAYGGRWDSAPAAVQAQRHLAAAARVCRSFADIIRPILLETVVVLRPGASLLLRFLEQEPAAGRLVHALDHLGIEREALARGINESYYDKMALMEEDFAKLVALLPMVRAVWRDPTGCKRDWDLPASMPATIESIGKLFWTEAHQKGTFFAGVGGPTKTSARFPHLKTLSLDLTPITFRMQASVGAIPSSVQTLHLHLPRHYDLVHLALVPSAFPSLRHLHLTGPTSHYETDAFRTSTLPGLLPQLHSLSLAGVSKQPQTFPLPVSLLLGPLLETVHVAGFDPVFASLSALSGGLSMESSASLRRLQLGWRDHHSVAEKSSSSLVKQRIANLGDPHQLCEIFPRLEEIQDFGLDLSLPAHRGDPTLLRLLKELQVKGYTVLDRFSRSTVA